MHVTETKRLSIRHFRPDDIDDLYNLCGDPETMRYVGDGNPLTRRQTGEWIEVSHGNYERLGFGCFALTLTGDDTCRRLLRIRQADARRHSGDDLRIGETVVGTRPDERSGRSYDRYRIRTLWLSSIVATIDPDNLPSIRIAEKLGMKFREERLDEFGLPELLFSIDREDRRASSQTA